MNIINAIKQWNESEIKQIISKCIVSNEELKKHVRKYNPNKLQQLYFFIRQFEINNFKIVEIDYTQPYLNDLTNAISQCIQKYNNQKYYEDSIKQIYETNDLTQNINCDCAICLDFDKKTSVITLKCNHRFHWNCLNVWLKENLICPMCKQDCL